VCDLENLKNEEAMTCAGLQHHRKEKICITEVSNVKSNLVVQKKV
jgi:hypothetical protein